MFKLSLLLLVASATAFTASQTSCYEEPQKGAYEWLPDVALDLKLSSTVHAVVYTKTSTDATVVDVKIETQFFAKAGMEADFTYDAESMTVTYGEKVKVVEEDETSGSMSVHGSAVAWVAAVVVAVFSMAGFSFSGSPSKISFTVLLVVGLAMMATTVESADGDIDCETFAAESRVIVVITFPATGERTQAKATLNMDGLLKDSKPSEDSSLCGACGVSTPQCVFGLTGHVTCIAAKAKATEGLVGFSWLDANCNDVSSPPVSGKPEGIIIFSHGWQKGGGRGKSNPCWNYGSWKNKGTDADVTEIAPFIAANYLVGQVHWERFADESEVKDAEAKIWSADGRRNMRYKNDNNKYIESENRNVPDQLWPLVSGAIADYANDGVRIIFGGHSLGSQVITNLAYRFTQAPEITTTQTFDLWLLDAFFSKGYEDYLGMTVGKMMLQRVAYLQNNENIRVHRTKTSSLSGGISGDSMKDLDKRVMFSEHVPSFFGFWGFAEKHNSAYIYWLRSIKGFATAPDGESPPDILSEEDLSTCSWKQNKGQRTVQTEDDKFSRKCY